MAHRQFDTDFNLNSEIYFKFLSNVETSFAVRFPNYRVLSFSIQTIWSWNIETKWLLVSISYVARMDGGVGGVAPERPITRYETRRIHSNKFWAKHTLRKRHTNIQNREFIIMKQLKRKTDQTIKVKIALEIEYRSRFFVTNRPTRVNFNTGCSGIGRFVPSFV